MKNNRVAGSQSDKHVRSLTLTLFKTRFRLPPSPQSLMIFMDDINWKQVRIDASINIMNAILSSTFTTFIIEFVFRKQISDLAVWYADKLVEELQKENNIKTKINTTMIERWKLFLIGVILGLFTSIIGPIIFNIFYFKKLDKEGIEYYFPEKRVSIWGGIFGTAITAVILLSIL